MPFAHGDLSKILIAEGKPQQAVAEIEMEPIEWAKPNRLHGWSVGTNSATLDCLSSIAIRCFKNLRHDPRFIDLLKKMRLPT
ncbi:MAG TPA: hypothetical protein VK638_21030 [Edaphobacter sp.]|nr:hypothetical protein [Edaphobacter sp.]